MNRKFILALLLLLGLQVKAQHRRWGIIQKEKNLFILQDYTTPRIFIYDINKESLLKVEEIEFKLFTRSIIRKLFNKDKTMLYVFGETYLHTIDLTNFTSQKTPLNSNEFIQLGIDSISNEENASESKLYQKQELIDTTIKEPMMPIFPSLPPKAKKKEVEQYEKGLKEYIKKMGEYKIQFEEYARLDSDNRRTKIYSDNSFNNLVLTIDGALYAQLDGNIIIGYREKSIVFYDSKTYRLIHTLILI